MQGLLSIGQFSRASRLSVRTLRRYDADGLLVPALVDSGNGRRYYSPAQLTEAELIRLLRGLDVPLEMVRGVLGGRGPDTARELLSAHRNALAQELARRSAVLAELDRLLADPRPVTEVEVRRRTLPEQLVVSARTTTSLAALPGTFGEALARVERVLGEQLGQRVGPTVAVYHGEEFDPEALDIEVAVPVAGWLRAAGEAQIRVLPAVDAVTMLHSGPYDRLGDGYAILAGWAVGQGLQLGPDPRESYLVGPDRGGPQEWRTEVIWPLDTRAGTPQG